MIESVYKKLHPVTGIIYVLINIEDKWVQYGTGNIIEPNKLPITFYTSNTVEIQPGQYEDWEDQITEFIDMFDGFDQLKYITYSMQCKDQITLMLIPKELMLNKQDWKEL